MEGRLLDKIAEPFNVKLDEKSNLEQSLDEILPAIRSKSNALQEEEYFLDRPLLELSASLQDTATKLWIFQGGGGGGSIFKTVNEKVDNGSWTVLDGTQKMVISAGMSGGTLYSLAFLDEDFLILQLYGYNKRSDKPKYLLLVNERVAGRMEWNDALEMLFAKYRNSNSVFLIVSLVIVLAVLVFVMLSKQ